MTWSIICVQSILKQPNCTSNKSVPYPCLQAIGPGGAAYVPVNIALIAFFNYYYTFLQVGWLREGGQLAGGGASIGCAKVHT